METPLQRLALRHRRVRQGELLLDQLTRAQLRLRSKHSPVTAELIRANIETSTVVAHSLELALAALDRERASFRVAREAVMARHGIPT